MKILTFKSPAAFQSWLGKNHALPDGIWLRVFKKESGEESITYGEALDQALCYGWIDGQPIWETGLEKRTVRKQYAKPEPTPIDSGLISFEDLAKRWDLNIHVTRRTVRAAGIPIVRLSFKTLRLRMIDVLKHEEQSMTVEPCAAHTVKYYLRWRRRHAKQRNQQQKILTKTSIRTIQHSKRFWKR